MQRLRRLLCMLARHFQHRSLSKSPLACLLDLMLHAVSVPGPVLLPKQTCLAIDSADHMSLSASPLSQYKQAQHTRQLAETAVTLQRA